MIQACAETARTEFALLLRPMKNAGLSNQKLLQLDHDDEFPNALVRELGGSGLGIQSRRGGQRAL
jgi:hypothetical protein